MQELGRVSQACLLLAVPACAVLTFFLFRKSLSSLSSGRQKGDTAAPSVDPAHHVSRVSVPRKAVGEVFGPRGSKIQQIQRETNTSVTFTSTGDERAGLTAVIEGRPQGVRQAEAMLQQLVDSIPDPITDTVELSAQAIRNILGTNGANLRTLARKHRLKISIKPHLAPRTEENDLHADDLHTISFMGPRKQIERAKNFIQRTLARMENKSTQDPHGQTCLEGEDNQPPQPHPPASPLPHTPSADKPTTIPSFNTLDPQHRQNVKSSLQGSVQDCAVDNPDLLFPGKEVTPESSQVLESASGQTASLPLTDEFTEVYVSAVEHPGHFWVQQLGEAGLRLEQLQRDLSQFAASEGARDQYCVREPVIGQLVASCYDDEDDSTYYRAKVIGRLDDGRLDLYFVDFGDNAAQDMADVVRLPDEFARFPFQAIECCLGGVCPLEASWSEEAITVFEDLTYCAQWKVLFAKVNLAGAPSHGLPCLQLVDTSGHKDVDVGRELVRRGLAVTAVGDSTTSS